MKYLILKSSSLLATLLIIATPVEAQNLQENRLKRNFQIDKTAKAMHCERYSPVEPVIYWVQIRETPSKSNAFCCSAVG